MTTVADIIALALKDTGVLDGAETPTTDQTADALSTLNQMLALWQSQSVYVYAQQETTFQTSGATSYAVGTGAAVNVLRPQRIDSAFWRVGSQDYRIDILPTFEEYESIGTKGQTGTPNFAYYNPTLPTGTLYFHPLPASGEIHIVTRVALPQASAASDTLTVPPEYILPMRAGLAMLLCSMFGTQPSKVTASTAANGLRILKRNNLKIQRLGTRVGLPGGVSGGSGDSSSGGYSLPTASATVLGGVKVGSGLAINSGVLSAAGAGSGTVTTLSVATANGFGGTVANPTTTPVITLTTSLTGIAKCAAGVMSAAVAGDFPTLNQNTTGSAATLTTPRAINGVNFDGSAAITVTADANTLSGTALKSTVVTSSLTTVGTIGTGTWQGTVIAGQYGGTGVANTGKTITLGGNLTTAGAYATTFTMTGATGVTFPTTGTLATLAGAESFTNKTLTDPTLGNSTLSGIKHLVPNSQPTTSATTGATTVDWSASRVVSQTELTGAVTYTFTAPGVSNVHLQLLFQSDGTSSAFGITWPGTVIWYGAAITTTIANKKMLVNFYWDGTSYHAMGASQV